MLEARDVGRAMERLRGDRKQLPVAQRAGINRSSWSSYESGRRMPTPKTYARIARGLGCDEAELDRAVLREWHERLQREGRRAGEGLPALPSDPEAPQGVLGLTSEEALTLTTASERIRGVIRTLLDRHD